MEDSRDSFMVASWHGRLDHATHPANDLPEIVSQPAAGKPIQPSGLKLSKIWRNISKKVSLRANPSKLAPFQFS
jgi:hypothetical protein